MISIRTCRAIFAATFSLIAIVFIWNGDRLVDSRMTGLPVYKSPLFFPTIALSVIAICGLLVAGQALRNVKFGLDMDCDESKPRLGLAFGLLGAFGLYVLSIDWLGYYLSTQLFVLVALALVGVRGLKLVIVALLIPLCLYGLFVWGMDVWFPEPWISTVFGAA